MKYVYLIARGMTNVGEENNAKMECVFQLEVAIHRVVLERNVIIIIKYVFLIAQEMTNVGEENNARMEFVFLLEGPWGSGLSKEESMRTLAGSPSR